MIRSIGRLIGILGLIFAVIWGVHTSILLNTARDSMADDANRWLMAASHSILSEIKEEPQRVIEDFPYLRSLVNRFGVFRISILDPDGILLADSDSIRKVGEKAPLHGTTSYQIGVIYKGAELVTAAHLNEKGFSVRSFFAAARDASGSNFGVLRVDIQVKDWEKTGLAESSSLVMNVTGGVILLTFLLYLFRWLVARPDVSSGSEAQGGGTAAVIETFHGLVRTLKEKEAELENLRTVAEKKAESFESYNENILQSVSSGVISFNTQRVITSFNQAAEKILGMSRSSILGKTCEEAFGLKSPVNPLLTQALERKGTISRKELELERGGNGSGNIQRIWVGVSTSLLRDAHDHLIGTTFVFTDLTEIKHLQEQVELNRRLTVLGEMSAGIAHEFRNYMGTVMGFTKLLSKKIPENDPGQEMADAIMAELKDMNVLIEQLLSFGRHDEVKLQPVDVEALVRGLLESILSREKSSKPEVRIKFPAGLKKIPMDGVLMRQAIGNLLQNAVESMSEPGVLTIEGRILGQDEMTKAGYTDARKTADRGTAHSAEFLLVIRDTGTGIPPEKFDKVFLPFFTTKEKGTGMGLALVHKIVYSHGGRIEIESRENEGTSFLVRLPMKGK